MYMSKIQEAFKYQRLIDRHVDKRYRSIDSNAY